MQHLTRSGVSFLVVPLLAASLGAGGTSRAVADQIVVDGAPVETKADPPCWPSEGDANQDDRFIDCGNGTVHDTATGLLWLENANCVLCLFGGCESGERTWWIASAWAAAMQDSICGLSDHSQEGDWRMATREEWEGVVDIGCPPPALVGKAGGCAANGVDNGWATNVGLSYQTSTTDIDDPSTVWTVDLFFGDLAPQSKADERKVWPVRDGS